MPIGTVDVASIAAGGEHSLALRADHSIVAWGDDSSGQNNVPQSDGDIVAIADGGAHSLALRSNGSGLVWGNQIFYPGYRENSFSFSQPVVAMAAGGSHSLALLLDGTVFAWGTNYFDGRPVPSSATNLVAVAAGDDFSLGVRSDGALVCWGALPPPPDTATNVVAIAAGGKHALALRADGALIAWGGNYFGQTSVPDSVTNVVAIAAGGDNSLALLGRRQGGGLGRRLLWSSLGTGVSDKRAGHQRRRRPQPGAGWRGNAGFHPATGQQTARSANRSSSTPARSRAPGQLSMAA